MTLRLEPLIVDSSRWACCSSCRSRSELELIPIESLDVIRTIYRLVRLLHNITTSPTVIFSDSQGSIALVKNPEYHSRTKHIDVQHHFVREQSALGVVVFKYVSTEDMVADVLTNP